MKMDEEKQKCRGCKDMDYVNEDSFCPACEKNGGRVNNRCGNHDCGVEVKKGTKALKCERCRLWYHLRCSGQNDEEYKALDKMKGILWFCEMCREDLIITLDSVENMVRHTKDVKEEMVLLRREVAKVKSGSGSLEDEVREMKALKNELMDMKSDILKEMKQSLKKEVAENIKECLQQDITECIKQQVLQDLKEKEDKENRSKNIVIYGVPESKANNLDEKERDDTNACCDIIENGVKVKEFRVIRVKRLGKEEENVNRNRPMLVELKDSESKWNIIKNAKNLKTAHHSFHRIFIALDQTKKEREESKSLREQLRAKREAGETGWTIRNRMLRRISA